MSYVLENPGYKFGAGGYGTSGGTVTWSFATSNFSQPNESFQPFTYNSFLTGQFQTEVRAALAAWEAVANVHFVEVSDSTASTLRFGFVDNFPGNWGGTPEAGGPGGRAGMANVFYDNSTVHHVTDADIAFDAKENWQVVNGEMLTGPNGTRFLSIALHEIGHTLGIDHDTADRSIMQPSLDPSYRGLEAIDIQAAQFIYGAAQAVAGSVAISDVNITEGNSGTQVATFTVTRTGGTAAFDVNFATANGTATAGSDYVANSGTLHFGANVNIQTISVTINGDTAVEPNETFTVNLSNATNGATISDGQGVGTIINDDTPAVAGSVAINDVMIVEGNSGTQVANFTVARSGGTAAFDVNFGTSNGTATTADGDYVANSGVVHFGSNVNTQTVSITINGDTKLEGNETFSVLLSSATNGATISDSQGLGIIANDDAAPAARGPLLADLNGDGRSDVLQIDVAGQGNAMLSTGSAFGARSIWGTGFSANDKIGDFNGDGKDDVIQLYDGNHNAYVWLSNGSSFDANKVWGSGVRSMDKIGDFNGDGKDDVIQLYDGNHNAYVWLSNGNGFNAYSVWGSGVSSNDKIGDFNGDGKDDVIQLYDGNHNAYVWLSNGTGFNTSSVWGHGVSSNDKVGDFNGDGKDDIIQLYDGNHNAYVWLSNGNGFNAYSVWGSGVSSNDKVGDFNGDGKDDIIQLYDGNHNAYVWLSNGNGFNSYSVWGHGVTSADQIADFNGDGKDDIIQMGSNGNGYVWISNGSSFNAYTVWGTGVAASGNGTAGGAGIDSGADNDMFVFHAGFGQNIITDFQAGEGGDTIQFDTSLFGDFNDVLAHTGDDGDGNTVISLDADNLITLNSVLKDALVASEFHFV